MGNLTLVMRNKSICLTQLFACWEIWLIFSQLVNFYFKNYGLDFQKSFQEWTKISNSLDHDEARCFAGPQMTTGPNCLRR